MSSWSSSPCLPIIQGVTWMTMEGKTFSMEKILINLIPGSSLSFRVSVKWPFSHFMVIPIPTDLRMNEMMLKWPFSHSAMVVNDWNEGGMMKFLNQGICPRFFSLSFCPHFTNVSLSEHSLLNEGNSWDKITKSGGTSVSELAFQYNREARGATSCPHSNIIQISFLV